MADKFTEVTTTGFGSRIGGAFMGMLLGPLLLIGAIILMSWNEGRAVQAIVGLGQASKAVVEAPLDAVAPANEGKLVHMVGPATAAGPIEDSDLGLSFADQVAVSRATEMYQWSEKKEEVTKDKLGGGQETTTTYTYTKGWASGANDSAQFKHPEGHENPEAKVSSASYVAADAKLGAFALDSATLDKIGTDKALTPEAPEGWKLSAGQYYDGDPAAPVVGNQRVRYTGLPSGSTVTVLAAQSRDGFGPFQTKNGYQLHLATLGNEPASAMVTTQKQAEGLITWLLRAVGFAMVWGGIAMFLGPLSALAMIIPFLGGLVRGAASLVSFVLAVPITLIVVALAWIAFRPLLGGAMLVVAGAVGYAFWLFNRSRAPAPQAA